LYNNNYFRLLKIKQYSLLKPTVRPAGRQTELRLERTWKCERGGLGLQDEAQTSKRKL